MPHKDQYTIRVQSLEYLPVRVLATKDGAAYDPTSDDVEIALPVINIDPTDGDEMANPVIPDDWNDADWQTIDDEYFARILVGPDGDVTLPRGDYDIYVRITDSPEIPVMRAGRLSII